MNLSPYVLYLIATFKGVFGFLSMIAAILFIFIPIMDLNIDDKKFMKILFISCCILGLLCILLPTQETLHLMLESSKTCTDIESQPTL